MREANIIEKMADAMEERIKDNAHPILRTIYQSKMDTLLAIADGDTDPETVDQNCENALRGDLDLPSFVRVQSARNAAAWARGDLDTL